MDIVTPDPSMFLLPPDTVETVIAKDQPEYQPLPALVTRDGRVISQWKPTQSELEALFRGQPITLVIHTFLQPLQPIQIEVGGMDLR